MIRADHLHSAAADHLREDLRMEEEAAVDAVLRADAVVADNSCQLILDVLTQAK